jgi:hypothetical protein
MVISTDPNSSPAMAAAIELEISFGRISSARREVEWVGRTVVRLSLAKGVLKVMQGWDFDPLEGGPTLNASGVWTESFA